MSPDEAGDLPRLVTGVDPGHPVDGVEPRLGHRRVDGVDGGPVDPGAAGVALEGGAARGIGPQPVLPQVGQVRRARRVAVGVDARDLHPAVPGVAVEIVGQDGLAGQGGEAQHEGHADDRRHGVAPRQPHGADHAGSPRHRPQGQANEQGPAVVPQRLGGDEGPAQAGAGQRRDGEAGRPAQRSGAFWRTGEVGHAGGEVDLGDEARACRPPAPATPRRGGRRPGAMRR